jgi:hypothetical protein
LLTLSFKARVKEYPGSACYFLRKYLPTWETHAGKNFFVSPGRRMTQSELIKLLKRILGTEIDLEFLARLEPEELEILVACVRDRLAQVDE